MEIMKVTDIIRDIIRKDISVTKLSCMLLLNMIAYVESIHRDNTYQLAVSDCNILQDENRQVQ